jgi:stage II sporulation protein R
MKGLVIFTSLVLIVCALCSFLPVGDEAEIYENTVRLHVLANSDTEHDQSVKLYVRDAVLDEVAALTKDAATVEEAEAAINAHIGDIREKAKDALSEIGEDTTVNVTLTEEYYPTREYDGFRLPAGNYTSLRILIGKAEGKNWWCVLFPPICLSAARRENKEENTLEDAFIAAGLTGEQYRIITESESTGRYKIRFKIREIIKEIGNFFS